MTWNDFEYNLKGSFAKLREDEVLYDMSLACEGKIIPAHQVVLGCCSPQLLQLLVSARGANTTAGQNPLVVLRGVSASDMMLILQFVYTGQVVVPQWQLNTFLAAAEDLEILGLSKKCANIHIGDGDEFDAGLPELATNAAAVTTKRKTGRPRKKKYTEASSGYTPDIKQEDAVFEDDGTKVGGGKRERLEKAYECEACQKKFARKAHLQRHEKAHSDFRPFVCSICEQKFKRKEHCFKHISTIHDIEDPTAHTEEIKLSEVLEAIESVNSEDEGGQEDGLDLSKDNI